MHNLYVVKDMLIKELEEFGKKGDLSKQALDVIDKLAHAGKNVAKIIEYCEKDEYEYSNALERSYRSNSYRDNSSYRPMYSRTNEDVKGHLRRLMENANNEVVREELRRMMDTF